MKILKFFVAATLAFITAAGVFAGDHPTTAATRAQALQRASRLRAEAAVHRDMAQQLGTTKGGSRGERRWRKRMVELCNLYVADALRTAAAYEQMSSDSSPSDPNGTVIDPALPVTADEYDERAKEYDARATWLRHEADRHLSMLQSARTYNLQPSTGGGLTGRTSSAFYETPRERIAREQHLDTVQQNLDLARDADEIAKHYRFRAQQMREVSR